MEQLFCSQCNEWIAVVEGVTAFHDRGYWWCAKHADVLWKDGKPFVDFPSDGKLEPSTIFVEG